MILEVCANSFKSAKNAQEAGAHRIELCSELALGGITPSYGLIKQVTSSLSIKTFVLIRPRSGDFVFSDSEFDIMKSDITLSKKLGVSGIVSGVLTANNTLDIKRTNELINLASPLPFTFHRAFDGVINPIKSLEQLIQLGVKRVLTSGQESSAIKGLELLQKLKKQSKNQIIILPGAGISPLNVSIFKALGFTEIHASASKQITKTTSYASSKSSCSDTVIIKKILKQLK
jgi:copper homeostasis protein